MQSFLAIIHFICIQYAVRIYVCSNINTWQTYRKMGKDSHVNRRLRWMSFSAWQRCRTVSSGCRRQQWTAARGCQHSLYSPSKTATASRHTAPATSLGIAVNDTDWRNYTFSLLPWVWVIPWAALRGIGTHLSVHYTILALQSGLCTGNTSTQKIPWE